MIPVYKPYLNKNNLKRAHDALDSEWIIWVGEYKDLVTEQLKKYLNVDNLLLLNNGTSACHFLAKSIKYLYPKIKKIIVPNNVYVAAWNGFLFDSIYDLIPIDSNIDTWNMDFSEIDNIIDEQTAILIVHNLGNIVNVPKLKLKYKDTIFVEDNCEGFSGEYEGKKSGTVSFASAFSFCGNKTITCGEGGAIVVNSPELYNFLHSSHCQGYTTEQNIHDKIGYNYRMTNVQAAILLGQIESLTEIKQLKNRIFNIYKEAFKSVEEIILAEQEEGIVNAEWIMGIRIKNNPGYDSVKKYFNYNGVDVRPMFYPINRHEHLKHLKCKTTNAELLSRECFMIPSFPSLSNAEIDHVILTIKNYILEMC